MVNLGRWLDRVSSLLGAFSSWLLLALIALINIEIILRYCFNTSTLFADEYSSYIFVWLTLLGFGQALRSGLFLRVDVFVNKFGTWGKCFCELIAAACGLFVSIVTAYACIKIVHSSFYFGSVSIYYSATPLWMVQIILPIGMGWLCLLYLDIFFRNLIRIIRA